jgi:Flp pilus assembly protein TadB
MMPAAAEDAPDEDLPDDSDEEKARKLAARKRQQELYQRQRQVRYSHDRKQSPSSLTSSTSPIIRFNIISITIIIDDILLLLLFLLLVIIIIIIIIIISCFPRCGRTATRRRGCVTSSARRTRGLR